MACKPTSHGRGPEGISHAFWWFYLHSGDCNSPFSSHNKAIWDSLYHYSGCYIPVQWYIQHFPLCDDCTPLNSPNFIPTFDGWIALFDAEIHMLHDLSDCKISSCSTPFNHYFRWLKSTVKITISWYKLPVSHEELMLVVSIASSAPSSLVSRRSALATAAALGFGGANVPEVPRRCRVKKMGTYTWDVYLHLSICISIYLYIYIYMVV